MPRGDGATTRQMLAAPIGSHYVWVNNRLEYPRCLALKLGREDLKIVSPDFFRFDDWEGIRFAAIIVDHAADLGDEAFRNIEIARESICESGRGGS